MYLGTRIAKRNLFLDNSHNIQDRAAAFKFADEQQQFAVYNLGIMDAENTRQDGSRPHPNNPAPLTEAETTDAATHKFFVDDSVSDDELADMLWESQNK